MTHTTTIRLIRKIGQKIGNFTQPFESKLLKENNMKRYSYRQRLYRAREIGAAIGIVVFFYQLIAALWFPNLYIN